MLSILPGNKLGTPLNYLNIGTIPCQDFSKIFQRDPGLGSVRVSGSWESICREENRIGRQPERAESLVSRKNRTDPQLIPLRRMAGWTAI